MTRHSSDGRPIRRILVLRPRALGDVILCTPALRALGSGFPAAELHVLVDEALAPVLRRNPHVHRLWLLPRRRPHRQRDMLRLYLDLAAAGFDLVLDLHGSPRTAFLAWLTRAPRRFGYALRGRGRFYNRRVPRDTDRHGRRRALYAAQTNLEMVARSGLEIPEPGDLRLEVPPDPDGEERAAALVATHAPSRPRIGLAAPGTWQAKTWPPEHWARLADRLAASGCTVILLWGPGERGVVEAIGRSLRTPAVVLPATDLDTLSGVLARLDLVVANDSGVKHLAAARGTPTLTLYGPTHPAAWSPPTGPHAGLAVAVPCRPCNRTRCVHHLCMRLLDPEAVVERALGLVATHAPEMRT